MGTSIKTNVLVKVALAISPITSRDASSLTCFCRFVAGRWPSWQGRKHDNMWRYCSYRLIKEWRCAALGWNRSYETTRRCLASAWLHSCFGFVRSASLKRILMFWGFFSLKLSYVTSSKLFSFFPFLFLFLMDFSYEVLRHICSVIENQLQKRYHPTICQILWLHLEQDQIHVLQICCLPASQ